MRVLEGGITPGIPESPYARFDGITSFRFSPTHMFSRPWSQPEREANAELEREVLKSLGFQSAAPAISQVKFTFDDLTETDLEFERLVTLVARIELGAILQSTSVSIMRGERESGGSRR